MQQIDAEQRTPLFRRRSQHTKQETDNRSDGAAFLAPHTSQKNALRMQQACSGVSRGPSFRLEASDQAVANRAVAFPRCRTGVPRK